MGQRDDERSAGEFFSVPFLTSKFNNIFYLFKIIHQKLFPTNNFFCQKIFHTKFSSYLRSFLDNDSVSKSANHPLSLRRANLNNKSSHHSSQLIEEKGVKKIVFNFVLKTFPSDVCSSNFLMGFLRDIQVKCFGTNGHIL